MGIRFEGHPDHTRILCPEDWEGHPLRKDYAMTGLSRAEMVNDKKRLYEIGGVRTGLVNKWNDIK